MPPEALRPATAKAAARQGRMRTRLTAGEKPNRKRMATPACVYDAEPAPRPHDVIAPPGGRHGSRTLRPKPKARAKWDGGHLRPLPDQQTGVPTLRPGPGRGLAHCHRGNRRSLPPPDGDRLDITGARWDLQGAQAILTLRAVISNGDFDEYWRYHLTREHQRLYPGTGQGYYTLGA
jgi:hypothetical protein